MSYIKADEVLPQNIIKIIQQYIDGENIYIPKKDGSRVSWGEKTGTKRGKYIHSQKRRLPCQLGRKNRHEERALSTKFFHLSGLFKRRNSICTCKSILSFG